MGAHEHNIGDDSVEWNSQLTSMVTPYESIDCQKEIQVHQWNDSDAYGSFQPFYQERCDNIFHTWIMNSVRKSMAHSIMYIKSASRKEIQ